MFSRVRAGRATPPDILSDLLEFHAAHPGITEATIGGCRTGSGHTGYDILAEQVTPDHHVVADLGCGNGPLLARLAAVPHLTRIVGVDACAAELDRVNTLDARIELSDRLPGRLDAVLSHHAFYLMQPADKVVSDLARAIRPGGMFAWTTTSGRGGDHPVYVEMMTAMHEILAGTVPPFPGWGDRRQWTPGGRRELFAGRSWESLEEMDYVLILRETPERIVERVAGFYYTAWLCDRDKLRAAWLPLLRPGPDGLVEFEWPWACVIARRALRMEAYVQAA